MVSDFIGQPAFDKLGRRRMNVKECASCFKKCAQDDAHCDSDLHVGVVGRVARELPLPEKQQSRRQGTASVSGLKSAEEQTWAVVVETTNPEKYFAKQGHLTKKKEGAFSFSLFLCLGFYRGRCWKRNLLLRERELVVWFPLHGPFK